MAKDGDYSALLDRIQKELNVDEITPDRIAQWLAGHDNRSKSLGRRRLGTMLSNIINKERQLQVSFSIGEQFAREKGITLTDKITSNQYPKWGSKHRPAIVIRGLKGRIKTWKYL